MHTECRVENVGKSIPRPARKQLRYVARQTFPEQLAEVRQPSSTSCARPSMDRQQTAASWSGRLDSWRGFRGHRVHLYCDRVPPGVRERRGDLRPRHEYVDTL